MTRNVFKNQPNTDSKLLSKALKAHGSQNFLLASKSYKKILKKNPRDQDIHRSLGDVYQNLNKLKLAEYHFRTAMSLDRNCELSCCGLAKILFQQANYHESIKYYEKSAELDPINLDSKVGLANAYKALGNEGKAEEIYQYVLGVDKKHYISLMNLTNLYIQQNKFDSARKIIEAAVLYYPKEHNVYYTYAILLKRTGDTENAIQNFAQAVKLKPNDIDSRNHIGVILSEQHYYDESIIYLKRTLDISSSSKATYQNLANSYKHKGLPQLALVEYGNALKLDPNFLDALAGLGGMQLMLGYFIDGWRSYAQVYKKSDLFTDLNLPWFKKNDSVDELVIRSHAGIGVGDVYMYIRLIHELQIQGINCVVEVEERMKSIFKRSFPKAVFCTSSELTDRLQDLGGAHQVLLGALPYLLNLEDSNEIKSQPYINPDIKEVSNFRNKYCRDRSNETGRNY